MKRTGLLIALVCLLALVGCDCNDSDGTPGDARAMRWWDSVNAEQMVAALHREEATAKQMTAAQKMCADLDDDTKTLVNAAMDEIYGDGGFDRVGAWWE